VIYWGPPRRRAESLLEKPDIDDEALFWCPPRSVLAAKPTLVALLDYVGPLHQALTPCQARRYYGDHEDGAEAI
jgi:hypothetical protein